LFKIKKNNIGKPMGIIQNRTETDNVEERKELQGQ
jgi:hypothetical protein